MSSIDEAGTGEGEAEPQTRSCSTSDGFTPLSADEQLAFRSAVSAGGDAAGPAMRSLSAPSESTPTPSLTPSLEEMKAAYEKAMDEAATMSSMDEAGTGEGEAEPQMRSCSSSDGFTALSADEQTAVSAEGEPASKRPRSAAVPLLPPRPVRQNAFVLRRTPL